MSGLTDKDIMRLLPAVDEVLAVPEVSDLRRRYPRFPWTRCLREVIDGFRGGRLKALKPDRSEVKATVVASLVARVAELRSAGMVRVINGTGVILHTNLGRAVLGPSVCNAAREAMTHYENLEVDLVTGKRGRRGQVLLDLITMATGAESAMVVNNNAAAVYLVVDSFSPPGRVLISRGELVEIGGSFRLPDILQSAGEKMIEVGTTNRTYIDDYAKEAQPGDILMRAHRSNYDIQGFTHDAAIADLVTLARDKKCYVVFDLGSGSFFDFAEVGIEGELQVADVLATGVDCVTMSGDKLLGGMQAGVVVGKRDFIDKLGKNPLRRALRVDKVTIAAMQTLMRTYLFADNPAEDVPVIAQTTESIEHLKGRAEAVRTGISQNIREAYRVEAVDDEAVIGGGSFAGRGVPSIALVFRCENEKDAMGMARRLRTRGIPVFSRIRGSELRVNMRSVLPDEDEDLTEALNAEAGG